MLRRLSLFAVALLALSSPALAQTVTVTAPNTVNPSGQPLAIDKTFIVNADGSIGSVSTSAAPSAASSNAVTPIGTSAAASALVIKASAGNLYSINIVTGATAGYLLVFNATTAPADGAVVPVKCLPVAANVGLETNMRSMPEYFSTGIVAVFSSTGCFTKTASATAFMSGDAK